MQRKLLRWLIFLPIMLLLGDIVYWHSSARQLETGFQSWVASARAQGWTVSTSGTAIGGWPLAATLAVTDLVVAGGQPVIPGGVSWDANRVVLRVELLQPWVLDILPMGVQRVRFNAGTDLSFVADEMHAVLPLQNGPPYTADLTARRLRVLVAAENEAEQAMTIGHLQVHVERTGTPDADQLSTGEPAVSFSLSAEAVELPRRIQWPLGRSLSSVTIEGALEGPLPPPAPPAALASAWRDGGGSLRLEKLALLWGPLNLNVAATLALDEQLQPMGAGTSRIIGYAATLDALAGNGVLTRSAAIAAKAVLSLLESAPAEGEEAEVDVPLTLQHRTLSMRQVPLVRLPELDWSAP